MTGVLDARGYKLERIVTPSYDFSNFDALAPDLLYVAGGPVGVYQKNEYPFLQAEIDIIKKRVAARRPTIGICLGSQLIANALGADNFKGRQGPEEGWHPLTLKDEGKNHPVRHLSGEHTQMFHWHGDTFSFPEGAVLLASSEKYPHQIFEYDECTLGLQCHTEVNNDVLKEWEVSLVSELMSDDNEIMSLEEFRTAREKHGPILKAQTEKFFHEWLEKVEAI